MIGLPPIWVDERIIRNRMTQTIRTTHIVPALRP